MQLTQRWHHVSASEPQPFLSISLTATRWFYFWFDTVVVSVARPACRTYWRAGTPGSWFYHVNGFMVTVIGRPAIFGGILQKIRTQKVLLWMGILFSVSALRIGTCAGPVPVFVFPFYRRHRHRCFLRCCPTIFRNIPPYLPWQAGRYVTQFNIIIWSILIAFLSNYFIKVGGNNDWRWMLGVMTLPSIIYTVMVIGIPEVRWLIAIKMILAPRILHRLGIGNGWWWLYCRPGARHEDWLAMVRDFVANTILFCGWLYDRFFNQWSGH